MGTAQVTVDDTDTGMTYAVSCQQVQTVTTIDTGSTTSVIDIADGLTAKSVEIRDLGGFSGSYWEDLGDDKAQVRMIGPTFLISGTATGFSTENPAARTTETFEIKVAC